MKNYAKLYYFYSSRIIELIRFLIFALLIIAVVNQFLIIPQKLVNIKFPLFFLCLFLIIEIFFKRKIYRKFPSVKVLENKEDIFNSFTLEAIVLCFDHESEILEKLKKQKIGKFMLTKMDIKKEDLVKESVFKEKLMQTAMYLVKKINGNFVTEVDVFAAYFLNTEDKTKLLFKNKLKEDDLLRILIWARMSFDKLEKTKHNRVEFWGEGVGEPWVYGWTIEIKKYMVDLTSEILRRSPEIIGRDEEYKMLLEGLMEKKSVLIIGEPGSGKDSLIQKLALDSYSGKLKGNLYHQRIFQLMVDSFLAGAESQGELEERLGLMVVELAHAGDIIILVKDFENILGNSSYKLDLSSALIPYIEKGVIRLITTTTPVAFKKQIEQRHELMGALQTIRLDVPDKNTALMMLFRNAWYVEKSKNIQISYRGLLASLNYADKYNRNLVLPGSAIVLLEDASTFALANGKNILEEEDIISFLERKIKSAIGIPKEKEKQLLLHLEEQIHKRVIDQDEAVVAISEAMRRLRSGLTDQRRPISFLFMGPTGVGKTETAKALAESYYGSSERMIRLDMSEYSQEDSGKRLLGALPGEGSEKGELTDKVYDNPYSLVLLDEFEKAHPRILDLFLQVLDDGRLTDNKGKTVSFANTIIIATSNAASEFIREEVKKSIVLDKAFKERLFEFLQINGIFKPELINRFDDTIVFKPLGLEQVMLISKMLLEDLVRRIAEKDVNLSFDENIVKKVSSEGFDEQFGARPLKRFIQNGIEDNIAKKILSGEINRGNKVSLSVGKENELIVNIN
ncbi:MAG: ATP-dependent Clp protease ATP-binding subunit [Candidatus Levyibacteriota bacterium]